MSFGQLDAGANAPDSLPRVIFARVRDAFKELQFSIPGVFHGSLNIICHTRNFWHQVCIAAELDLKEEAKLIPVPVLLAWGVTDATVALDNAVKYYDRISHCSVYVCTKGCHNWLIERPEEYLKVVREFVSRPANAPRTIGLTQANFTIQQSNHKQD